MDKLNPAQTAILDELSLSPAGIVDIAERSNISVAYARIQIKILEERGRVERVDNRTPYIYRIPKDDPLIRHKSIINAYEKEFADTGIPTDSLGTFVRKAPKNQWLILADNMEAAAIAIRNLDNKGLLLETLED